MMGAWWRELCIRTQVDENFRNAGGRFPSDVQVPRARGVSAGESSTSSADRDAIATAGAIPGSTQAEYARNGQDPYRLDGVDAGTRPGTADSGAPVTGFDHAPATEQQRDVVAAPTPEPILQTQPVDHMDAPVQHTDTTDQWVAPAAIGVTSAGVAGAGVATYKAQDQDEVASGTDKARPLVPEEARIPVDTQPTDNAMAFDSNQSATETKAVDGPSDPMGTIPAAVAPTSEPLSRDAYETSPYPPQTVRRDTEMSVSQLPLPGRYPKEI